MMRTKRSTVWLIAILMGTGATLAACGGGYEDDGSGSGSLEVNLGGPGAALQSLELQSEENPVPVSGIGAITITFARVDVHTSANAGNNNAGWIGVLNSSLPVEQRTFDLLEAAAGNLEILGLTTLGAGTYQQVRIIIEDATITVDEVTSPLSISSGAQTGLKFNHPFTIVEGEETILALDFDEEKSVSEQPAKSGNYFLDPVIAIVEM